MRKIYNHYRGYNDAIKKVQAQSYEEDLRTIDDLFGREHLKFGDGPEEVKAEALRQLEIEWRDGENEMATIAILAGMASRG